MLDHDARFEEVVALVEAARGRAYEAVNSELVSLYWQLGEHISRKIASAEWGDGVVEELATALSRRYPGLRGFTRPNLFRMRQFYEAYRSNQKVSALLRQLPWTHHLIILGQAKPPETREFYILAADPRAMVISRAGTPDPIGCGAAKCSLDEEGVRRTGSLHGYRR